MEGILGEQVRKEIEAIIDEKINDKENKLTKDELNEIVSSLIPSLDELVAKQVKHHMVLIAQYVIEQHGGKSN